MRTYRQTQEVDWRWLMKFLEVEMAQQMMLYSCPKKRDSVEARQDYMDALFSFYLSLRSFLKLSPITKTRRKVEEFIQNGPGNRR